MTTGSLRVLYVTPIAVPSVPDDHSDVLEKSLAVFMEYSQHVVEATQVGHDPITLKEYADDHYLEWVADGEIQTTTDDPDADVKDWYGSYVGLLQRLEQECLLSLCAYLTEVLAYAEVRAMRPLHAEVETALMFDIHFSLNSGLTSMETPHAQYIDSRPSSLG